MEKKLAREGLYHRIARIYNLLDWPYEVMIYRGMRKRWIAELRGETILEVGVGTGKNLRYYHESNEVLGIDRSPQMLAQAEKELRKLGAENIDLLLQEELPWNLPEKKFTTVVATFVMCTMKDPLPVFEEIARVVTPGTRFIIFEYTKPKSFLMRMWAKLLNPTTRFLFGVDFNRGASTEFMGEKWKLVRRTNVMEEFLFVAELERV